MTSRGYLQWELVGEGSDPVPASEYDVDRVAKVFSDQGAQMNDAAKLLRQLSELSGWSGESAKEFADKASEGYGDLDKAAEKYVDAGKALSTFATAVGTARDETKAAVDDAVAADAARRQNAESALDDIEDPTEEDKTADEDRAERLSDANAALTAARTRLVKAMEALDKEAETAAKAIRAASEQFKDSTMDNIKGAVSSALKVIVDALQVLAIILAVVIIVLLIIGTAGAFAGVLALVATLTTISLYLGAAILALVTVQFLMGDAGMDDLAWAALGVFGGAAVLKGGKAAVAAINMARTAQVARVTASATRNLSPLVRFSRHVPINFIRNWALGRQTTAVNAAVNALNSQLDSLASTSKLMQIAQVDGLVTNIRQINALRAMNPTAAMTAALNSAVRNNVLLGTGTVASAIAQGHDLLTIDGPLANTIDNIHTGIDMMNANPPVGPISEPINFHVSGAGR